LPPNPPIPRIAQVEEHVQKNVPLEARKPFAGVAAAIRQNRYIATHGLPGLDRFVASNASAPNNNGLGKPAHRIGFVFPAKECVTAAVHGLGHRRRPASWRGWTISPRNYAVEGVVTRARSTYQWRSGAMGAPRGRQRGLGEPRKMARPTPCKAAK
jgi:hypothetical protein